jgi:hypothetical protein
MSINQLKQLSVRDASLVLKVEAVRAENLTTFNVFQNGSMNWEIQEVQQTGSSTTTVDCGANALNNVRIQGNVFTVPANSYSGFHLLNNKITTGSIITATILSYSGTYGTNGLPVAFTYNIQPGDVEIGVMNTGSTPLNGNITILVHIDYKWVV